MKPSKNDRIKRLAVRLVDRLGGYILISNILGQLVRLRRTLRNQRAAA